MKNILAIGADAFPGQLHKGIIGTGDVFVHDSKRSDTIRANFPRLHAVEMEAGAVGQVCTQFQVPFVIMRGISDIAGKESHVTFDEFLTEVTQKYTTVLKGILGQL